MNGKRRHLIPIMRWTLYAARLQYRQATRHPLDCRSRRPSSMNLFLKPRRPHRRHIARHRPPTTSPMHRNRCRKLPRPQQAHMAAPIAARRVLKRSMWVARPAVRSAASPARPVVLPWRCPAPKPAQQLVQSAGRSAPCSADWRVPSLPASSAAQPVLLPAQLSAACSTTTCSTTIGV